MKYWKKISPERARELLKEGAKVVIYRVRFVRPYEKLKEGAVRITDPTEIAHWQQYWEGQRWVAENPESSLSPSTRKAILEAVEAFEETPERIWLVKEPMDVKG